MSKIDKNFDGVSWDWKGRKVIKDLKPICPECRYELNIKIGGFNIEEGKPTKDNCLPLRITLAHVLYSCPKCKFSIPTSINGINEPKDLHKAALKEFEHRQRLMEENNKQK